MSRTRFLIVGLILLAGLWLVRGGAAGAEEHQTPPADSTTTSPAPAPAPGTETPQTTQSSAPGSAGGYVASDSAPGSAGQSAPAPEESSTPTETTFGPQVQMPATSPSQEASSQPSAEEVMQRMLRRRQEIPVVEPISQAPVDLPAIGNLRSDRDVLGSAPGQDGPTLRREGEFIVGRRGRVLRTPDGFLQFRFEADAEASPEPPIYLMPCQMLEHMEQLSEDRKEEVVFVLSGQVFVYRGRNWLLPTMMKLDIDRGNLRK
ncbi:MAG: hypothetical protein IT443_09955 [Phycisphaeraceae bacterium]|nr:hypothetical protein [Phycisphaeraceae bacterium]